MSCYMNFYSWKLETLIYIPCNSILTAIEGRQLSLLKSAKEGMKFITEVLLYAMKLQLSIPPYLLVG